VYSIISVCTTRKFVKEISVQRWEGKIFSNQQLGMRGYMKLVKIMGLE
jgi:hypothetical protein